MQGINDPQLARLVRRAAVPEVNRTSQSIYKDLRTRLEVLLTEAIAGSSIIAEHHRVITISAAHVDLWLSLRGVYDANAYQKQGNTLTTFSFTTKRNKAKTKEIKTSLHKSILKPLPFRRLCRTILLPEGRAIPSDDVPRRKDMRFARQALEVLQFYAEATLGEQIRAASLIASSDGRSTLLPEDMVVALQISHAEQPKLITAGPISVQLERYIYRELKQVAPDLGITSLASQSIQRLLGLVFSRIMAVANALMRSAERKTLAIRDVQSAIALVFSGELRRHTVSEGTRASVRYNISIGERRAGPPQTLSSRAGLTFPIARFVHAARALSFNKRISERAIVFLVGALEHVAGLLLEYAGNQSRKAKKARIATKYIQNAINSDEDFSKLFGGELLGTNLLGNTFISLLDDN